MKALTLGSCFSGIGGLELGLEAALGCQTIWQIELEEYPRQVLAKHWPQADRSVTDIRKAGAHNLKPVTILVGGFPCTGISTAGRKKGLKDERSGLWFEMVRCIGELRPRYLVLENSSTITAIQHGAVMSTVLSGLARLGYDGEWHRVGAADCGADHRRWRWFFIGHLSNTHRQNLRQQQGRGQRQGGQSSPLITDHGKKKPLANPKRGRQKGPGAPWQRLYSKTDQEGETDVTVNGRFVNFWSAEPRMGRVVDGFSSRVHRHQHKERLKALGNAVVPQVAYVVGLRLKEIIEGQGENP